MQIFFLRKHWQIVFFNILTICIFIFFYGKFGDLIVDSFREVYIPEQMLHGNILYKNILTIYPPLSYIINSVLFFIFGANLKVIYISGLIATLAVLNILFLISNCFISKNSSLAVVLLAISTGLLSPNVFNYIFPYSYGILYGLMFILASMLCLLKKKSFWAYIFYSLAICCKYEFILFLPLLIYACRMKNFFKNFFGFCIPIIITFVPLFLCGLGFNDLINSIAIVDSMSTTKTLYWFYSIMGLVFRQQLIPIYITNFLKVFLPVLLIWHFPKKWLYCLVFIYSYFFINNEIFIYACPLLLLMLIIRFKNISPDKRYILIGTLLISAKVFFALTMQSYGVFFIPLAALSVLILLPQKPRKALLTMLIIISITIGTQNIILLNKKNTKIQTDKGIIYTNTNEANSINSLISYIKLNTSPDDTVLVYPECLIANFMSGRKSDNKFYSLIPLYVETFGEDKVITRLKKISPKLIIINNYNTENYYYRYFGYDYAQDIMRHIATDYERKSSIGEALIFTPYVLKN